MADRCAGVFSSLFQKEGDYPYSIQNHFADFFSDMHSVVDDDQPMTTVDDTQTDPQKHLFRNSWQNADRLMDSLLYRRAEKQAAQMTEEICTLRQTIRKKTQANMWHIQIGRAGDWQRDIYRRRSEKRRNTKP